MVKDAIGGPQVKGLKFIIQVSPTNCVGCGLCANECLANKTATKLGNDHFALKMVEAKSQFGKEKYAEYLYKHEPIIAFSIQKITDIICANLENSKIIIMAPVVREEKGTQKDVLEKIKKNGFMRLRVDGKNYQINEVPELVKTERHDKSHCF